MDFYYMEMSPFCRSVMLTAKALDIKLNKKIVNLMAGEQKTPEYLAINFQHTIPTLVDGKLKLWESRAICTYLVNKYGKDDSLYPKCPEQRALVDRLLYFDMGSLYRSFGEYVTSKMDFYYIDISSPSRAVMLTAKALDVKLNKKFLNLLAGEQKTPEFLAMNFQHTVPTLIDGDLKLWESRAICTYLVNKYGKDDSLYPKCPKQRALVDRLLYFDMGSLYKSFGEYVYPTLFGGEPKDDTKIEKIQGPLGDLNTFLEGHDYAVGNHITVADHCLVASVSTMVDVGIDISKHSNVVAWLARCKTNMPGYDTENDVGAKEFGVMAKAKLG